MKAENIYLGDRHRFVVEGIYYVVLFATVFQGLGFGGYTGVLTFLAGLATLVIYFFDRLPIPQAFKYILIINLFANLSQVLGQGEDPLIGEGLPNLLHWGTFTLILAYLCRSPKVETRMLLVTAAVIILSVQIGGFGDPGGGKFDRLRLEEIGGRFSGSNSLAYMAGVFSVVMLFRSLHATFVYKMLYWTFALLLAIILVRTLSRGGVLTFSFGIGCFILAILLTKGKRDAGIATFIVITITAGALLLFGGFDEQIRLIGVRAQDHSFDIRIAVYTTDLLGDLWGSVLAGYGPGGAHVSGVGIKAHNSFIYTHMAFGGLAAYTLTYWIFALGWKIKNSLFSSAANIDSKLFGLAMYGMMVGCLLLTNSGYLLLSSIYAIGVCEALGLGLRSPRQVVQRQ